MNGSPAGADPRPPTTIRAAAPADRERCLAIAGTLPDSFTESALPLMSADLYRHPTTVALIDGRVVGFLILGSKSASVAEVLWLAVEPAWQGGGVGSALLEHAAGRAETDGVELLEVKTLASGTVSVRYEGARRLYERHGFRLVEVVDPFPGWELGNPCAIYVKALRAR